MTALLPVALLVLAAAGCDSDPLDVDPRSVTFAPELGIDLDAMIRKPSGLYYQDLEVGVAPTAMPGLDVAVLYEGWLPDGFRFDAAEDPQHPLIFRVGWGQVIRGWDEGVAGMRTGGVRRLVIPPSLGYGKEPTGAIPANSVLVFEVRLQTVF